MKTKYVCAFGPKDIDIMTTDPHSPSDLIAAGFDPPPTARIITPSRVIVYGWIVVVAVFAAIIIQIHPTAASPLYAVALGGIVTLGIVAAWASVLFVWKLRQRIQRRSRAVNRRRAPGADLAGRIDPPVCRAA